MRSDHRILVVLRSSRVTVLYNAHASDLILAPAMHLQQVAYDFKTGAQS